MNIPFFHPDITDMEIEEVIDTLKSGWITTGPKTKLFEKRIAAYVNTSKAVCLSSATAAMELTLRLLGIGEGDEVITSAYTYTASASVIAHVGAKIVLVDTGKESFHMDYEQLEQAITEKTKAVIAVDIAGVMCDYDKIFEVVLQKQRLFKPSNDLQKAIGRVVVIADAAHSIGAVYKARRSGQAADFTCFSFHAVKNITTAEGGAVTWRDIPGIEDEEIYKKYMLFSLHGQSKDALAKTRIGAWEYDILHLGYKSNMTDTVAALGLGQFSRIDAILERRKQMIELYDEALKACGVRPLRHYGSDFSSSGHLYMVNLIERSEDDRNKVIALMAEKGISTNVHYKPLPMHTAYKELGFQMKDYPNAFNRYSNEITLPLYTQLTNEQVRYVASSLKEAFVVLDKQVRNVV